MKKNLFYFILVASIFISGCATPFHEQTFKADKTEKQIFDATVRAIKALGWNVLPAETKENVGIVGFDVRVQPWSVLKTATPTDLFYGRVQVTKGGYSIRAEAVNITLLPKSRLRKEKIKELADKIEEELSKSE